MILYYTATQKTKVFAEALRDTLGLPMRELKSPLNDGSPFAFLLKVFWRIMTGKISPVSNMPDTLSGDTVYVCAPVWAGRVASPAQYFLNNADLTGKTVHILLTCASLVNSEKYRLNALALLQKTDCKPGNAYVFATSNALPEHDVIMEQLRVMLPEAKA